MNKNNYVNIKLGKGEINAYDFGGIKLYAYKTNDFIDDEVFILVKNGKGVVIELPCFFDNIEELTAFLKENGVGGNTPVIIKYPFWRVTLHNPKATYACINYGELDLY